MHIVRYLRHGDPRPRVGVVNDGVLSPLPVAGMFELLQHRKEEIERICAEAAPDGPLGETRLLAPVDGATEVWASGVTYLRSRDARVEESALKSVYELVYDAERPELFFKSPAWRVVTDGEPVGIRSDSALNVPEPELALVVNRFAEIVGYVVCNDMSSRSVEGENPLYLPQAKMYAGACALSSGVRPAWEVDPSDLAIRMTVAREDAVVWDGTTSTSQIKRPFTQLTSYLFHSEDHPHGAVLSTGTGLVPDLDFTLREGDLITVAIEEVGELRNRVVVGKGHFGFLTAPHG
ncbi:fumarylacetoacetate (FAA) hydrolase [Microbispora rosea subsp. aerata]|nr:fumarylacetoacetate hydrolase family protein [Microbispora rosea]GGO29996.1 fumarylacetoacetate (FAA) hydrolase [Microbispora rosea subsp. aerata]GIH59067.1 fumarylacetoacetate (FAA) hydrolase [Microbispora rosea subsp. aerata]GLJ83618.1 fumarylacetoacetate hydrolase [Microbispora rosea subsp. aerata]